MTRTMTRAARTRRFFVGCVACMASLLLASPSPLRAGLTDIFTKDLSGLELEPLGPALANTVATTYPVASASSSVTYVYNPAVEAFERQTRVLGPIIGERAETIGRGQFNVNLSYAYINFDQINGQNLHNLLSKPVVNGRVIAFPIEGGIYLADGRFSSYVPVQVNANIHVDAQIVTPGFTYGVTPDLDVNFTVPLVSTYLSVRTVETVPDPRLPEFQLPPNDPNETVRQRAAQDQATGVGDLLLRLKYTLLREQPADFALGLGVSAPTGNKDDFQGTGYCRVQPSLIVSRVFWDRFEPLFNLGVDLNTQQVGRSALRWAVGGTTQAGPVSTSVVFLARNEFGAQADKIADPFFFQIERNDIYDLSVGFRWLVWDTAVVSANFIVPVNDDGLRADVIPMTAVEYTF